MVRGDPLRALGPQKAHIYWVCPTQSAKGKEPWHTTTSEPQTGANRYLYLYNYCILGTKKVRLWEVK